MITLITVKYIINLQPILIPFFMYFINFLRILTTWETSG
jgi:hypothetical protein